MAAHPSMLAWRIPWTEKSSGLYSSSDRRVGHDWGTNTHPHPQRRFTFTENWATLKTGSRNSSLLPFWGTLYNSLANADVLTKAYGLIDFHSFPLLQIFSLFTGARLNLRDKVIKYIYIYNIYIYFFFVWSKKLFIALPGKEGPPQANALKAILPWRG